MNIELAQQVTKAFLQANVPLHVWGPAGVGKSTYLEDLAEELGYHLIDLRLATQEVGDLIGVPYVQEIDVKVISGRKEDGSPIIAEGKRMVTRWAEPYWMSEVFEKHVEGIVSLVNADEMDRAPREVVNAFYQFVTKRQFHEHKLPKETRLVAAGNPPTEEYMVETFDDAMVTRWGHIQVECDADVWIRQFAAKKCHPDVSGFIAIDNGALMKDTKVWDVGSVQHPTPRGWDFANKIYEVLGGDDKHVLQVAVGAIIGRAGAMKFIESLEKSWVHIEDVLSGKANMQTILAEEDGNLKLIRLAHEIMTTMTMKSFDKNTNGDQGKVEQRKDRFGNFIEGMAKHKQDLVVAAASTLGYRDPALFRFILVKNPAIGDVTKSLALKMREELF